MPVVPARRREGARCPHDAPTSNGEEERATRTGRCCKAPASSEAGDAGGAERAPRYRVPWAELLQKVFAIDVLECPRCAGRLQLVAYIADGGVAKRILDHLGMRSQAPPLGRTPSPDELTMVDAPPDYDVADPTWAD